MRVPLILYFSAAFIVPFFSAEIRSKTNNSQRWPEADEDSNIPIAPVRRSFRPTIRLSFTIRCRHAIPRKKPPAFPAPATTTYLPLTTPFTTPSRVTDD
jgi:hypothetical protein